MHLYIELLSMALHKLILGISLLSALHPLAQQKDTAFAKDWLAIDTLIVKGDLTRTALEKVNTLYQKAKQQQLPAQIIKSLVYRYTLEERITSNNPNLVFDSIQAQIATTKDATQQAILYALLAKRYRQYYNDNRWTLYRRKTSSDTAGHDIAIWSTDDLQAAITRCFSLALENIQLLQQQNIDAYEAIIIKGEGKQPRSLFDLLAREALDYYKSGETYITRPVYAFTVSDTNALAGIDTFIGSAFVTTDKQSQQWLALRLLQQLLQFHRNDADKNSLLQINIERIEWVYRQAVFANKESAYVKALEEITARYKDVSATSQAWYLLAKRQADKALTYQPFGDTTNRYGYVHAIKIVADTWSRNKELNQGTINLQNLQTEINRKELRTQAEMVNIPGKPLRALVSYRNIDTIYQRIIVADDPVFSNLRQGDKDYWKAVAGAAAYRTFKQVVPKMDDHQLHSVEIKLEQLPVGRYALLSSTSTSFTDSLSKICVQFFQVSNISYIRNKNDFFVLDRETGKPMPDVKVVISRNVYDRASRKNVTTPVANRISDKNGFFMYKKTKTDNSTINLAFTTKNDRLGPLVDYIYYNYDNEEPVTDADTYEEKNKRMFFFTDRSIYRPGQTVFFKGIAITKDRDTKLSKLVTDKKKEWVYLNDANGKRIDSVEFTLNSYGSFSGKFQLPQNILTGSFQLDMTNYAEVNGGFNVEEYKRPTFTVSFEKVKGSYRLNDSVTITGTAIAYSGNNIDGAKVAYSVKRNTRFNNPWFRRGTNMGNNSREISHGDLVIDPTGRFTIRFKALADDIADKTGDPLFDFSISTDVTDINGETRSANTQVTVGYSSLLLHINTPAPCEVDSLKKIRVKSTTLDNEKEPALVHLKIYSLRSPDRPVRKRYWKRPDQFIMGREEFLNNFPTDEYEEETNPLTWATEGLVLEASIDTNKKDSLLIAHGLFKPGHYRLEATATDTYGGITKTVDYIELFSRATEQLADPRYQFHYGLHRDVQPGETASFLTASVAEHLFVIRKTTKLRDKISNYQFIERNKGFTTNNYSVLENDRGGVSIEEVFVYDNRVYSFPYYIDVPWKNKQLTVNYSSYRNKTEPGNKENWTVTVQGDKNEKVSAELLTVMYDASLDQFKQQVWNIPDIWESETAQAGFENFPNFSGQESVEKYIPIIYLPHVITTNDHLASDASELWSRNIVNWSHDSTIHISVALQRLTGELNDVVVVGYSAMKKTDLTGATVQIRGASTLNHDLMGSVPGLDVLIKTDTVTYQMGEVDARLRTNKENDNAAGAVIRKNFSETAFFFPQLYADSSGKYSIRFTMPETLTQWKWMSIAHTRDLAFGANSASIITQKKLMVQANAPRFMREGDNMEFSTKISNLSDKEMTGQVTLELFDPFTNTSVDGWLQNVFPSQYFTVEAGQSFGVKFPIQIPVSFGRPLGWRVVARSGNMSDGEENILPVVTNRMLVTESLPLLLQSDTTQHFRFDKLLQNSSESLTHKDITIEYTTNPVWYAVQALPYLMEYPYECAEQTFNRLYANTLASFIVNQQPAIKQAFEQWKKDSSSLKSNLQKNEELKQVLLQETPWVLEAESETQQKKNIALLFDTARLNTQTENLIEKLNQLQLSNGSFSWFKGGYEDRYITNYILIGLGKLKRLGALTPDIAIRTRNMLTKAIRYLDERINEDYTRLLKNRSDTAEQQVSGMTIDYLYMRSFFGDIARASPVAYDYFYRQGKTYWIKQNSYYRAELGLVYYRSKEELFTKATILPALLENAVMDPKQGMYWKNAYAGYWYLSPIEHQSMMIAFMSEIGRDHNNQSLTKPINAMKTWLLLNKQTNNWGTTIATADACYALLLNGSDWLSADKKLSIRLGNLTLNSTDEKTEAGSGYFKKRIEARAIKPEMGNITVTTSTDKPINQSIGSNPSWGTIYWQYFEDLDKITPAAGPLSLNKKLFIERNTDKGKVLAPVKEGDELKTGDKVVIRLELRADRDMDYLHLKDMRAATMEPVNVLSGFKWQDRLGYYESTKDVSSNFFISHLPKGTYVFDYPVFITNTGVFSAGIATIQCMYAPEFTSHSEGIKIRVVN